MKNLNVDVRFLLVSAIALILAFSISLSASDTVDFSLLRIVSFVASFLTIYGMYKLAKVLCSIEEAAWLSSFVLLLTFVSKTKVFLSIPDSFVAFTVLSSLLFYAKKNYLTASILATLSVVLNQQTFALAVAYVVAEILLDGFRYPKRLFSLLMPLIGFPLATVVGSSGYEHGVVSSLAQLTSLFNTETFLSGVGFYAVNLLSDEYRWFPIIIALAGMIRGLGRDRDRRLLPFVLVLVTPMLFFPPDRLLFLLYVSLLIVSYTIRERLVFGKLFIVFLAVPFFSVLSTSLLVTTTTIDADSFISSLIPAYPIIILGAILMLFKYYPKKVALPIGVVYLVSVLATSLF